MAQNSTFSKKWELSKLSEVIGIVKGRKPRNLDVDNSRYSIPYVNIEAFEKRVFAQYTDGEDSRICNVTDILLVWDGARCGLVGKGVAGAIGSTLAKLEITNLVPSFVFYFLQSQYDTINKSPRGIGIPHIDPNVFWNIEIPIPPLHEQERIVAKIEELFTQLEAGTAALRRIQAGLKRYKASVLKSACEGRLVPQDPSDEPAEELLRNMGKSPLVDENLLTFPKEWCWTNLGEIQTHLKNGFFYGRPATEPPGIPILRISAIRPLSVNFDKPRYLPDIDENQVKDYFLKKGDLLFTRYNGNLSLVGACGMVRTITHPVLYPDKLIRVRVKPEIVISEYIEIYFATETARRYIEKRLKSTAGQYGIAGSDLKTIPIPIPPLEEQHRIVAEVERRLSVAVEVEAAMNAALARSARLRQTILKRAFEGRLVEQNPKDESAMVQMDRMSAREKTKVQSTPKQARLF